MTSQLDQALRWRKSSYSGSGNNCVEITTLGSAVAVRDSKNPDAPPLAFSRKAWRSFTASIKTGGRPHAPDLHS